MMKKILALLLCVITVFSLVSCELGGDDASDTDAETKTENAGKTENGNVKGSTVVIKGEHYSATFAEVNFYFMNIYSNMLNSYYNMYQDSYAEYLQSAEGLDINKSLKIQSCPYLDNEGTYFDYLLDAALSQYTDIIGLCEYADEKGITLTDEEKESAKGNADYLVSSAAQAGVSLSEFMGDKLGITTEEVINDFSYKNALAAKAREKYLEETTFTDDEYKKEYEANTIDYAVVDYLVYTFQTDDVNVTTENIGDYADDLAGAKSEEEFCERTLNFVNNVLYKDSEDNSFDINSIKKNDMFYGEGTAYLDWMFKSGAKAGETFINMNDDNTICSVYYLINAPRYSEYNLKSVRHILFSPQERGTSLEECKTEAERIYALYKADPTEENFAKLANENSDDVEYETADDGTSKPKDKKEDGGLIENIDYNQTAKDFENWCFDTSRKPGDTGIITSTYGYHIMYFVGNGKLVTESRDLIQSKLLTDAFNKYKEDLNLTIDKEYLNNIDI